MRNPLAGRIPIDPGLEKEKNPLAWRIPMDPQLERRNPLAREDSCGSTAGKIGMRNPLAVRIPMDPGLGEEEFCQQRARGFVLRMSLERLGELEEKPGISATTLSKTRNFRHSLGSFPKEIEEENEEKGIRGLHFLLLAG
ncbi:hypothetical protein DUI87_31828 [Hirundo rustica rustica]|uniref:Uncharacterized protein n=1 Tax=Hirundo rustica rustica TaxID=333673 RepID=A0A3M0IYL5_HIRRU|nr:hypothetical protein DUI87_31828 [Hirundo rustica rustica]